MNKRVKVRADYKDEGFSYTGFKPGDMGTVVFGSDYVPGLDAGRWTVEPDGWPKPDVFFGHKAISYWTEGEMLHTWEYV